MTFRRQLRRALDFMQVARQWDIVRKVSTLSTDSARNMIAASRQLPFEHICLELHIAPTIHHSVSTFTHARTHTHTHNIVLFYERGSRLN